MPAAADRAGAKPGLVEDLQKNEIKWKIEIHKKFEVMILGIVFLMVVMCRTTPSDLLQPEISFKILNTENVVFAMEEDLDGEKENDLEMIEIVSDNLNLNKKLRRFHKYVKAIRDSNRGAIQLGGKKLEPNFIAFGAPKWKRRYKSRNTGREVKTGLEWFAGAFGNGEDHFRGKSNSGTRKRETVVRREEKMEEEDYEEAEAEEVLQKEYEDYLEANRKNNTSFKYTDEGKPEESFADVAKKIMDFKPPKNCTNVTGIGIQAMECLVMNAFTKEISGKEMLERICLILLAWFCIYLAIAIPLWCTKGWCFCCFRCSICFPRRAVREIEKYISKNPPGVYLNSKGEEERYNPSARETELYEKIKKSIAEF